jgi:hypothetical protein
MHTVDVIFGLDGGELPEIVVTDLVGHRAHEYPPAGRVA